MAATQRLVPLQLRLLEIRCELLVIDLFLVANPKNVLIENWLAGGGGDFWLLREAYLDTCAPSDVLYHHPQKPLILPVIPVLELFAVRPKCITKVCQRPSDWRLHGPKNGNALCKFQEVGFESKLGQGVCALCFLENC